MWQRGRSVSTVSVGGWIGWGNGRRVNHGGARRPEVSPAGEVGPNIEDQGSSESTESQEATAAAAMIGRPMNSASSSGRDEEDGADHGAKRSTEHGDERTVTNERVKRRADETWWDGHTFDRQQIQQRQIGRLWQQKKQDSRRRMEEVHEWLQQAQGKCVFCLAQGGTGRAHRSIFQCDADEVADARSLYNAIKKGVRKSKAMSDFAGCSFCFVPQAWCHSWRRKSNGADGEFERAHTGWSPRFQCQYEDVVIGTLAIAIVFTGTGRASYVDGLDQRIRRGGGEGVEAPGNLCPGSTTVFLPP